MCRRVSCIVALVLVYTQSHPPTLRPVLYCHTSCPHTSLYTPLPHTHAHIHVCSGSGRSSIRINRERMDEETFEEGYKPSKRKNTLFKKFVEKITPPEPIKSSLKWVKFEIGHRLKYVEHWALNYVFNCNSDIKIFWDLITQVRSDGFKNYIMHSIALCKAFRMMCLVWVFLSGQKWANLEKKPWTISGWFCRNWAVFNILN